MKTKYSISLDEIPFLPTNHPAGLKKTFFNGDDTHSALTQFAYGHLESGQTIPEHQHPTMEEFFYFLSGLGTYTVEGEAVEIKEGVALKIPAGHLHVLHAEQSLHFVYFGIAISK